MAEKFQCEIVTLDKVYSLCNQLAQQIVKSGYKVDVVIAVARGGFVPARLICDFLHVNNLTSLKVHHYEGTDRDAQASLQYPLNADIQDKNVLVVDDVNDTGKSIHVALRHMESLEPKAIKTAVMHEKKGSILETDFHVEILETWRWLIYEWAVVEDVGSFIEKSGLSDDQEILNMLKSNYGISWTVKDLEVIAPFLNSKVELG